MNNSSIVKKVFFTLLATTHLAAASAAKPGGGVCDDSAASAAINTPSPLADGRANIRFLADKFPYRLAYLTAGTPDFTEDPKDLLSIEQVQAVEDSEKPELTMGYSLSQVLRYNVTNNPIFSLHYPTTEEMTSITDYDRDVRDRAIQNVTPGTKKDLMEALTNPTNTMLTELAIGARLLQHTIVDHGDGTMLFLGRTPCYLQAAYEELMAQSSGAAGVASIENLDHIKHVSYSGCADTVSLRPGQVFADQTKNLLRNHVTPERLAFFEEYLTEQGLDKVKDKLYIVDIIGTGLSLNSFLRILDHYYTVTLERTPPTYHFVGISLPFTNRYQMMNEKKIWQYDYKESTITFTENFLDRGVVPMTINASPLHLSQFVYDMLDDSFLQYYTGHGSYFPAHRWSEKYRAELNQGGRYHNDIYEKLLRPFLRMEFEKSQTKDD